MIEQMGFVAGISFIAIAVLIIKGIALWTAAKKNHKGWFIILLIINTLGILDAVYLLYFQDRR